LSSHFESSSRANEAAGGTSSSTRVQLDRRGVVHPEPEHAALIRLAWWVDEGEPEEEVLLRLASVLLRDLLRRHAEHGHAQDLDERRASSGCDVEAVVDSVASEHAVEAERTASRRCVQGPVHDVETAT
jgi:hypothetical protein